jgi:hypothetical protein
MFCPKCGASVDGGVKFCPSCGERLGDGAPTQTAANPWDTAKKPGRKLSGKTLGIAAGAVVALVLLIALASSGGKGASSPEKAARAYVNAALGGDTDAMLKYSAVDLVELRRQALRGTVKEAREDFDSLLEVWSMWLAASDKPTITAARSEKLVGAERDSAIRDLTNAVKNYDSPEKILNIGKVGQIYRVEIDHTSYTWGVESRNTVRVYVGKIGGRWYVLNLVWKANF